MVENGCGNLSRIVMVISSYLHAYQPAELSHRFRRSTPSLPTLDMYFLFGTIQM
jgi:hypothetical protein